MLQKFEDLQITALASAVPQQTEGFSEWKSFFGESWNGQLPQQTGISSLRKSVASSLELGIHACQALFANETPPNAIISITQTPARQLPGNASAIAAAMGWQHNAPLCWDLQMGCAGMIWGLYQAALLLQNSGMQEVLLVCAETHSRLLNPNDRATRLLFGDGAAAMRITKKAGAAPWHFSLGTQPDATNQLCTTPEGQMHMDGLGIFNFTVGTVVPSLEAFLKECNQTKEQISAFLMHQASGFVLQYMQRMLQIPSEKMPIALDGYGNTASASIGILLAHHFEGNNHPALKNALLTGFGSGLQWGHLLCDLSETTIHGKLEV